MYTGSLGTISNREDWIVDGTLTDQDGDEVDLTAANLEVFVCPKGCPNNALLTASTTAGTVTLTDTTVFRWQFTPDDLNRLCAGTYEVYFRCTIDDVTTQIFAGTIPVVDGGPR